jgi:hypothetical protein
MLLLMLAVPSLTGVLADRRLRRSLDDFNNLVNQAHELSISEHRAYLIVFGPDNVELRPEVLTPEDDPEPTAVLPAGKNGTLKLALPAALAKDPPPEWIFWPSGACEPAVVEFTGRNGMWTASYSALTARAELIKYAAR